MAMYDPLGLTWPRSLSLYISLHEEAAMAARPHVNQGSGAPDQNLCRKSLPRNLWGSCKGTFLQRPICLELTQLQFKTVS